MMEKDERLKVLILRTLGLSQDDVAGMLHCAKQSAGEVERWFRDDMRGEAIDLLDDQRIKRLVGRDFPSLELEPTNLIRAAQITADDILLHYGRASTIDTASERLAVAPAYATRLEEHWERLRQVAANLREQLSPLPARILFSADVCRIVHAAAESGAPLPQGDRWRQVFDAPVEVREAVAGGQRTIEARLLVENEFLFPQLLSHLQAEFPESSQLATWKARLGEVVGACLEQARDVTLSCSTAAGLPYVRAETQEWLSFQFPAYLCQVVMQNPGRETAPELVTEAQSDGSWRLRPKDYPAIALAEGSATADTRCREAFDGEVRRNAGLEAWRQITGDLERLESSAAELRLMLATVIERGDFRGTCPLCGDYFVRTGRSRGGPA
jgi:hypothetical protein